MALVVPEYKQDSASLSEQEVNDSGVTITIKLCVASAPSCCRCPLDVAGPVQDLSEGAQPPALPALLVHTSCVDVSACCVLCVMCVLHLDPRPPPSDWQR